MWTCLFSRLLEWRGNLLSTLLIVVGGHGHRSYRSWKTTRKFRKRHLPTFLTKLTPSSASFVAAELNCCFFFPKTQCSPWFWVEQGAGKIWFVSSRLLLGHPGTEMENVLKTQRDILIATQKKLDHAALDKFGARNKRLIFAFGMVHKTEMSFARNSENCILHV